MKGQTVAASNREWGSLLGMTAIGALGLAVVFWGAIYVIFNAVVASIFWQALISAVILAVGIGAPSLVYLGMKQRELAMLKRRLNENASIDPLTHCLNSLAFSSMIEVFGAKGAARRPHVGTFLVIDVDQLKAISSRFGHGWGDEALRAVAAAVRTAVRSGDLVGRIGGETFGVYLPGAALEVAESVAARIQGAVSRVIFEPGGERLELAVSLGGVFSEDQLSFDDLYREAETRLEKAKLGNGRQIEPLMLRQASAQPIHSLQ